MFLKEKTSNVILTQESSTVVNEAYRLAMTNLSYLLSNKSYKSILVTSSSSSEGKTTICKNIAIAFAETNNKVLIIDSDMRSPKIHELFVIDSNPGLSDILRGFSDIHSCISETGIKNLSILPSGTRVQNPSELLASPVFQETISLLSETYDYIFIDTPAVNLFADSISISNKVDAVVIVAKYAETRKKLLLRTIDLFKMINANLLGVLFNCYDTNRYYEDLGIRISAK